MRRLVVAPLLVLVCCTAGCFDAHQVGPDASQGDTAQPTCSPGSPCDCRAAVLVPSGTYFVGMPPEPGVDLPDGPAHLVTLTASRYIGTYEAAAGCYRMCAAAGACTAPVSQTPPMPVAGDPRLNTQSGYWQSDASRLLPIVSLSKDAAREYCRWLGGRLPTNAEWEAAARGPEGRTYPWLPAPSDPLHSEGDSLSAAEECLHAHRPYRSGGRGCVGTPLYIVPIDSYPDDLSPFGLYQVAGNALEWVDDTFARYPDHPVTDPVDTDPSALPYLRGIQQSGLTLRAVLDPAVRDPNPIYSDDQWSVRCAFDTQPEPLFMSP